MNRYTEIIDQYLSGQLTDSDKQAFEARLKSDPDLQKELEAQKQLMKGIQRQGIQNQVKHSAKKIKQRKTLKQLGLGLVISLAVLGAVVLVKTTLNKPANEIRYELNEQGNRNWSEADKQLESQVFEINPLRDTILETQHGIVVSIPAETFMHANQQPVYKTFELEIKEAMTPYDIMKAGLSTTSNGKLLETGGMFYVNARSGDENLTVRNGANLSVSVPVDPSKTNMQLFDGERKADGSINWINPKPMTRRLTTVDILKLNFYPEHFLDSLATLGIDIKNKKLTDSIYYSYSGMCGIELSVRKTENYEDDGLRDTIRVTMAKNFSIKSENEKPLQNISIEKMPDGEVLFRQNCAVCHSIGTQKLTGPGLAGILNRAPSYDWVKQFTLNNEKVIQSGEPYANKIYNDNGKTAMTVFEGKLSDLDVHAILKYITGKSGIIKDNETFECPEINPARIKAIWDKQFNQTILATKEFEERLHIIFHTCNANILNLYIKNMDHPLYELDSVAAGMCGSPWNERFLDLYSHHDGGVDISTKEQKKLMEFFEKKRKLYTDAETATLKKLYEQEEKTAEAADTIRVKHGAEEAEIWNKTFREELTMNMKEAYRQLGEPYPYNPQKVIPIKRNTVYLSSEISVTGWKNVDAYVFESTLNRTSLDYTSPKTGKKAQIRYEPIEIAIDQKDTYDRIVAYMIPDKLSSYQTMRMDTKGVNETLNELMKYSVVIIGFKNQDVYSYVETNARPGHYKATLQETTEEAINKSFAFQTNTDLGRELNYQLFEQKETVRLRTIEKRDEMTQKIWPWVYPCANLSVADTTFYAAAK